MKKTKALRELIQGSRIVVAPGVTNAFFARIVEEAGFEALYVTGAGVANALLAKPDVGLVTMTELVEQARRIARSTEIPVISDADTGYGNPINVMRTVEEFEQAGVAGIHIEDQIMPKKCGHFENKQVIPASEMVHKIRAAIDAREDDDFVIIARTDALAVLGLDEAIARGREYVEAGADMMFVDAPESVADLEVISKGIRAPLVVNMAEGGKTPLLKASTLEAMGYRLVLFPNTVLRVAGKAVQEAMRVLHDSGTSESLLGKMLDWRERQRIVGLESVLELGKRYGT